MSNELNIQVTGNESLSPELEKVQAGAIRTERVIVSAMGSSEEAFDSAARQSGRMGAALDHLSGAGSQLAGGIDDLGSSLTSIKDIQNAGAQRAAEQARKLLDVDQAMEDTQQAAEDLKQAQLDLNQAQLDSKQATLDVEQAQNDVQQAMLDAEAAQTAYNDAVANYGPTSAEAKQAAQDLKQVQTDLKQANLDSEQAIADKAQAETDSSQATRDMSQAAIDARESQLNLTDAQREAKPPTELQAWGQQMQLITPLIMGVVGATDLLILANNMLTATWIRSTAAMIAGKVATMAQVVATGIATAAQWLWNIAMTANPIGLIIVAIAALIAIIIVIATKTTWFQDLWNSIWGTIGEPVKALGSFIMSYWSFLFDGLINTVKWWWNMFTGTWKGAADYAVDVFGKVLGIPGKIGDAFMRVGDIIYAPFKYAFNMVAWAWNNTIGRLHWTAPDWVPGIGGNSISVPRLPQLARGGEIIRDGAAYVHRGEVVVPASTKPLDAAAYTGGSSRKTTIEFIGNVDTLIAALIMKLIRTGKIKIATA